MRSHVAKTKSSCFAVLCRICAYVSLSPGRYCNRSSSHWCWHGWTTATQLLLIHRFSYSTDSRLSWTQRLDRFSMSESMINHVTPFCANFTGCVHCRESNTGWRCWCSIVNMEWFLVPRTYYPSSGVHLTLFLDTCGHQRRHWPSLG